MLTPSLQSCNVDLTIVEDEYAKIRDEYLKLLSENNGTNKGIENIRKLQEIDTALAQFAHKNSNIQMELEKIRTHYRKARFSSLLTQKTEEKYLKMIQTQGKLFGDLFINVNSSNNIEHSDNGGDALTTLYNQKNEYKRQIVVLELQLKHRQEDIRDIVYECNELEKRIQKMTVEKINPSKGVHV